MFSTHVICLRSMASELSILLNSRPLTSVRFDKTWSNLLPSFDVDSVCLCLLVVTTLSRAAIYRPSTFVPSVTSETEVTAGRDSWFFVVLILLWKFAGHSNFRLTQKCTVMRCHGTSTVAKGCPASRHENARKSFLYVGPLSSGKILGRIQRIDRNAPPLRLSLFESQQASCLRSEPSN